VAKRTIAHTIERAMDEVIMRSFRTGVEARRSLP